MSAPTLAKRVVLTERGELFIDGQRFAWALVGPIVTTCTPFAPTELTLTIGLAPDAVVVMPGMTS